MLFFKKKNQAEKNLDDRLLISENAASVEALIVIAKGNPEVIGELKDLQEKLKYLIPSANTKIAEYDKTIKNKLGDLRIALTKADGETTKKVTDVIEDIKVTVVDRNTKL